MHHFVSHQRRGWGGSLSRTGDDDLPLHTQRGQGAADISALLDAVFIEAALFVLLRAAQLLSGTGVAQKIEKHFSVTIPFRSTLGRSTLEAIAAERTRESPPGSCCLPQVQ